MLEKHPSLRRPNEDTLKCPEMVFLREHLETFLERVKRGCHGNLPNTVAVAGVYDTQSLQL